MYSFAIIIKPSLISWFRSNRSFLYFNQFGNILIPCFIGPNICHNSCWASFCLLNFIYWTPQLGGGGVEGLQKLSDKIKCFILFFFFDNLQLQIIESISPKASVENSSAQWAIFYYMAIIFVIKLVTTITIHSV